MADQYVRHGASHDNRNRLATKRCPTCKRSKPLDQFGRNHTGADGRHRYCLECINAKRREAYHREVGVKPQDEQHISRQRLREAILEAQGDPPLRKWGRS